MMRIVARAFRRRKPVLQAKACATILLLSVPLWAADKYSHWLNEEVVYIISDAERKAFQHLTTAASRDRFIEEFWEARKGVKEEHYRRIQYANENFGKESGTPGWRTDMGRTYILFGKPQSRQSYKGYSQYYPMELWFYSNNTGSPSLPPFFYVLFFLPEDIGEYRYYHPYTDGPLKLVRGTQFRSNRDVYNAFKQVSGELARAAFTLVPGDPIDTDTFSVSMTGDMLINRIQELNNDPAIVKRIQEARYLRAKVNSWLLVPQQEPLDIASMVLTDFGGRNWLDFGVLVNDEKLGREAGGNLIVNSSYRIVDAAGKAVKEGGEERAYPAFEGERFKPFLLANRVELAPGKYKIEVQLSNREAGRSYKGERGFEVRDPHETSLLGPLVAAAVAPARQPDALAPFQYYGYQFQPAIDRRVSRRDSLKLLFQVHAGSPGDYRVEYVLASNSDRTLRKTFTDDLPAKSFKNGLLLKSRTLPLEGLDTGDYHLIVNLRGPASEQVLASSNTVFHLGDERPQPALYFLARQ